MTDAPEKIWAFPTHVKKTHGYFSPSQTNKVEVGYIREDIYEQVKAERDALEKVLRRIADKSYGKAAAQARTALDKLEKNDDQG